MQSTKFSFDNFIPCFQLGAWEYRQVQNVIDFSIRGEMPNHPSPKPIEAMRKLIETFSDAGELILDPFAGSGTTLVAAKLLGRPSIGIEMNEKYCQIIVDRLNKPIPLFEREAEQTELPLAANSV
jgi:DNA modification methylase